MGSKGGTTVQLPQAQAQTSSVAPNPVALQAYSNVVGQAQGLQGQNLGFAPQQQQAFNEIGGLQGAANPYLAQAGNYIGSGVGAANQLIQSGANAGSPQNFGQNIQQYMNPYINDVVRSTMANINETNAQQQSQLTGNAIAQGAMGGNRVGVAGAELARQQDMTNNATLANILQSGYGQAGQNLFQGAGMQMQGGSALGGLGNQAGGLYAGLGSEAMSTGLQGANALLQAGGMQQALPYQQLAWLSGIVGNQGPLMGQTGTQNSMGYTSQYAPQPNMLNSILGAGVAGAGLFAPSRAAHGGRINKAHGGGLGEYDPTADDYGAPIGGGFGAIPEVRPTGAHGLQLPQFQALQQPQPHQQQQQQDRSPSFGDFAKAGKGLGSAYDKYERNADTSAMNDFAADYAADPSALGEARGGRVRGYDDGGEVVDTGSDPVSDEGRSTSDIGSVLREAHSDPVWQRIVQRESGGQHFNPDGTPKVGGAGEYGIAQIKPATAQEALTSAGLPYDEDRVKNDPAWNEGAGYLYYKNQRDRFGSPSLGAAAYNAGPTRLAQALAGQGNIPASTRAYVADVTGQPTEGGLGAINTAAGPSRGLAPASEGRSADVGGVSPPDVPDAEPGFLERLGVPKISPDTKQALIAAGLGMMASKSHWLGPAIGEGGLQGIKTYYENQQAGRQNALAQSTIGYRKGQLGVANERTGIERAKLQLQLQQNQRLLDAARAASGVPDLGVPPVGGVGPSTVPPGSPLPIGPGAGVRPGNPVPPSPAGSPASGSAPASASAPAPSPASTGFADPEDQAVLDKVDPRGDPRKVLASADDFRKQAEVYRRQANIYRSYANPEQAAALDQKSDAMLGRANEAATRADALAKAPLPLQGGGYAMLPSVLKAQAAAKENETVAAEKGKRGTQMFEMNKKPYEEAAAAKDLAIQTKANAQAIKNLVFDENGKPIVSTGPQGEFRAKLAANMEQSGWFSPETIKTVTSTDPANAEAVQKLSRDMVGEVARQALGPGNRLYATEYKNYMQGVPSVEILPRTIQFLTDRIITPKSDWTINRFAAIHDAELHGDNIQSTLFKYDQEHPLDELLSPKKAPAMPVAAQRSNGQTYQTPNGPRVWRVIGDKSGWAPVPTKEGAQ